MLSLYQIGQGKSVGWFGIGMAVFLLGVFCSAVFLNIQHAWCWFIGREDKEIMKTKRQPIENYRPSSTQQLDKMKGNISYSTYHAGTETIKLGDQRTNRVNKYFQFYVITSMKSVGIEDHSEEGNGNEW